MKKTTKKLEIPKESVKIYNEYFKFLEYFRKHAGVSPTIRDFMQFLETKNAIETTKDGLYKIKDEVEITYED